MSFHFQNCRYLRRDSKIEHCLYKTPNTTGVAHQILVAHLSPLVPFRGPFPLDRKGAGASQSVVAIVGDVALEETQLIPEGSRRPWTLTFHGRIHIHVVFSLSLSLFLEHDFGLREPIDTPTVLKITQISTFLRLCLFVSLSCSSSIHSPRLWISHFGLTFSDSDLK